eukprot:scaffold232401_cov21-Tisochrysis_lutea.AAC.2
MDNHLSWIISIAYHGFVLPEFLIKSLQAPPVPPCATAPPQTLTWKRQPGLEHFMPLKQRFLEVEGGRGGAGGAAGGGGGGGAHEASGGCACVKCTAPKACDPAPRACVGAHAPRACDPAPKARG